MVRNVTAHRSLWSRLEVDVFNFPQTSEPRPEEAVDVAGFHTPSQEIGGE